MSGVRGAGGAVEMQCALTHSILELGRLHPMSSIHDPGPQYLIRGKANRRARVQVWRADPVPSVSLHPPRWSHL